MRKHLVHESVLLKEVTRWLQPSSGVFIDCTLGAGGHAEAILEASPLTEVVGLDRDLRAIEIASNRLARFKERFKAAKADFRDIASVAASLNLSSVRGVLADLGVSSMQIDEADRGFSFSADAPLDMRMDQSCGETASDIINRLDEKELADLIFEYGEERASRRVARAIVSEREKSPITTTARLAAVVARALRVRGRWRIHPATRVFQALRIAVNDELRSLEQFIPAAISILESRGRLAIISFHSLEDRIVKRSFQRNAGRCICQPPHMGFSQMSESDVVCNRCGARKRISILTRKPVRPDSVEVERNPRSRSARLRVCEKI
ncbi:MAG: 16S rRNA (cytosine(1402)-N(4))-methyltransferase RsmH [Acidobacteriota bacterium]